MDEISKKLSDVNISFEQSLFNISFFSVKNKSYLNMSFTYIGVDGSTMK